MGTMEAALKKLALEEQDLAVRLARFLFRQRMVTSSTGTSPAALMLGREIRSKLDLIRAPLTNHDVGGCKPKFEKGEPVSVRDYRSDHPKWASGHVKRALGRRMVEVSVPDGIWRRHYNQTRRRFEACDQLSSRGDECLIDFDADEGKPQEGMELAEQPEDSHEPTSSNTTDSGNVQSQQKIDPPVIPPLEEEDFASCDENSDKDSEEEKVAADHPEKPNNEKEAAAHHPRDPSPEVRRSTRDTKGIAPVRYRS